MRKISKLSSVQVDHLITLFGLCPSIADGGSDDRSDDEDAESVTPASMDGLRQDAKVELVAALLTLPTQFLQTVEADLVWPDMDPMVPKRRKRLRWRSRHEFRAVRSAANNFSSVATSGLNAAPDLVARMLTSAGWKIVDDQPASSRKVAEHTYYISPSGCVACHTALSAQQTNSRLKSLRRQLRTQRRSRHSPPQTKRVRPSPKVETPPTPAVDSTQSQDTPVPNDEAQQPDKKMRKTGTAGFGHQDINTEGAEAVVRDEPVGV